MFLQTAQARDEASDVTTLLIYRKGRYFHCLEGPTHAVKALWSAIQRGPRHTDVHLPGTAPITNRFFSNWDMRLVQPDMPQTRFTPIRCMSRLPSMRCVIAR